MENRDEWLARTFVDLAECLIDGQQILPALALLAERAAELPGAAAEVAVTVIDGRGHLGAAESFGARAWRLETLAVAAAEGPAVSCYETGLPVFNHTIAFRNGRWAAYEQQAATEGFRLLHVVPLRTKDRAVGALTVLQEDTTALAEHDARLLLALVDAATLSIVITYTAQRATRVANDLQAALSSRVVIEQAKGVLSARLNVDIETAFATLRRFARDNNAQLRAVAAGVVDGSIPAARLRRPRGGPRPPDRS